MRVVAEFLIAPVARTFAALSVVPLFVVALSVVACGGDDSVEVSSEPAIFSAFPPAVWMARELAGDSIDVVDVLPPGRSADAFRPTREDLHFLQSAPLIVLHGAEYERWALTANLPRSRVLELAADLEPEFITVETVTHSHGAGPAHSHAGINPYLWLDPDLARRQLAVLHSAMAVRFPEFAETFAQGFARLEPRFIELSAKLAALAPRLRAAAVFSEHPDWAYPARRHGFEIGDWELGRDADAAELDALVAELGARACVVIFDSELEPAVVERCAARGVRVVVWPRFEREMEDGYLDVQFAALERLDRALPQ